MLDRGLRSGRSALFRSVVVGMLLSVALAACSGSTATPSSTAAPAPTATAAPAATPTPAPVSFAGKTIHLIVGYDPGGSYDDAARSLQPYLEAVTGATVVVDNMPGAGNLIALNAIWAADPDGLTIGTLNGPGNSFTVLTDTATEAIQFDLTKFGYLAGLTTEPRLMTVGASSPYQTFADLLASDREVLLGVTGSSGAGYNDAVFLQTVFGDKMKSRIVSGFKSGAEAQLSLIAGEVDVNFALLGGELPAIEAGDIRGLVVLGKERSPKLPDVPAITEYDLSAEALALLDVHVTLAQLGIILVAPPNMPADVLAAIQDAVYTAATDPKLVADTTGRGLAWNPRDGEEIRAAVVKAMTAPASYVDMMKAAIAN